MKLRLRILPLLIMLAIALAGMAQLSKLFDDAAGGDPEALYRLSMLYERGYDTIPADSVHSLELLRRSAEGGYAPAANYLGFKLYSGDGVDPDREAGLRWIERAAKQGDLKAYNNLGYLLSEGDSALRNYERAAYWYGKASEGGVSTALASLGDLYRHGRGVERDTLRADSLYVEAIRRGLHDAELKLLSMNLDRYAALTGPEARVRGIEFRRIGAPIVASALFEIGEEKGDTLATVLLADALSRGEGVPYDYDRALLLFVKGAQMGDPSAAFVVAETIEMFPDLLDDYFEVVDPYGDPAYWYEMARSGGVTNAEEAWRRLK